jgi:glutamine cyclotransferase
MFISDKTMQNKRYFLPINLLLLMAVLLFQCRTEEKNSTSGNNSQVTQDLPEPGKSRLLKPSDNQRFIMGESVQVEIAVTSSDPAVDSMAMFVNGTRTGSVYRDPWVFDWTAWQKAGTNMIRVTVYYGNRSTSVHNVPVVLLSDEPPARIEYRVMNTYPHDTRAYTQGLVYEDGHLYEGTGQENESSLRKVEIKTGEPVRLLNLASDIFGEGITIFQDRIFQLTYKSQVGFVYEKESFTRLQRVYYDNKEGWGLTTDGKNLIMSDGSHLIYYMDPVYFTEVKRIEVYNQNGPVTRLNELEWIDGKIFANVYGKNHIVVIDPASGKVTGRMDFKGILKPADQHNRIDVFNGIAWDGEGQRLFVTGKYWPKLFEVKILSAF